MAGRGRELKVYLTSDVSKFTKGLGAAENRLRKFARAVGIGVAAVGALAVKLGTDAVKAAAEDEKRVASLTKVMENFGKAAELPGLLESIDAMQRQYGIAEDQLTPAFIRLLSATDDTGQALKLLTLALDLSAASGKSLDMSAKALGRAIEGSTGGLAKLGVGLSAADIKAAGLEGTIGILEGRFGGTAAKAAETMTGKVDRLAIAFDELQESFGTGLLDGGAADQASNNVEDLATSLKNAEPYAYALGQQISNLTAYLDDFLLGLASLQTVVPNVFNNALLPIVDSADFIGALPDDLAAQIRGQIGANNASAELALRKLVTGSAFQGTGGGNMASNYDTAPRLDTYSSSTAYNQTRYNTRANDATGRGDARGAQREARTRQRP